MIRRTSFFPCQGIVRPGKLLACTGIQIHFMNLQIPYLTSSGSPNYC